MEYTLLSQALPSDFPICISWFYVLFRVVERTYGQRNILEVYQITCQFRRKRIAGCDELAGNQITNLSRQFQQVRQSLELFASKHRSKIKDDPRLRSQFQAMCSSIGVDPLAYSHGCWSETLGLGEFYYHLGVKIIEACMAHQKHTGGIIPLRDLVSLLNKNRSKYESEISDDDVKRSIKKLRCLGTGFSLISLPGGQSLVQSVPGEMSMDQTLVLGLAESSDSHVTASAVMNKFFFQKLHHFNVSSFYFKS
uniref:Vacuolar-sorting protein SNF8 n=1 Tax=Trichobilharzia regenti TaxID=157069 RepID=A0AA85JG53_TRIRE|nr:unnamed protein product [Trichobilharzia regenti]